MVQMRSANKYAKEYAETRMLIKEGCNGRISLLKKKETGLIYAVKILLTSDKSRKDLAVKEYKIMAKLNHKNIITMVDAFDMQSKCLLVMEYHTGGSLKQRVDNRVLKEKEAIIYLKQITDALQYMHKKKIGHCDIKSDNIIFVEPESKHLKIIDFGLAHKLRGQVLPYTFGDVDYRAPEINAHQPLTVLVDMWSLGVLTYFMLSGRLPFKTDTETSGTDMENAANNNLNINRSFVKMSKEAKDFIESLLVVIHSKGSSKRLTAAEACRHPWLRFGLRKQEPPHSSSDSPPSVHSASPVSSSDYTSDLSDTSTNSIEWCRCF